MSSFELVILTSVIFRACYLNICHLSSLLSWHLSYFEPMLFLLKNTITEIYANFRPFLKWDIGNFGDDSVLWCDDFYFQRWWFSIWRYRPAADDRQIENITSKIKISHQSTEYHQNFRWSHFRKGRKLAYPPNIFIN